MRNLPPARRPSMAPRRSPLPGGLGLLVGVIAAFGTLSCAKVTPTSPGDGTGGTPGIPGRGGTGGTPAIPPRDAGTVVPDAVISTPDANICQQAEFKFEPKIPTVYLLVDRSGSMFDCISTSNVEASCPMIADTTWTKLKDGILPVVERLQSEVRFGFATIVGSNPRNGGMCPILNTVEPALNNYTAISNLYQMLSQQPAPNSTQSGVKWETPTRQVLETLGTRILADTTPGDKYILFITDGEPDYCGDGNSLCPPDAVVWQLQKLKEAGITTIVFGLKATIAQDLPPNVLDSFANAGAGEPTLPPVRAGGDANSFYDQCFNMGAPADESPGGWTRDLIASGKPMMRGTTLGTYSATAGPTKPYQPDVNNQQQLVNVLSAALSGVKSCGFDLGNINGKAIRVDLAQVASATVSVGQPNADGSCPTPDALTPVPLSETDGWFMASATQLELRGSGCTNWRKPENKCIHFGFPCEIIIIE